jgi:DUF1365 family protein
MLRSRLFACQVSHHRFRPRAHGFRYGIFLFALDLDEIAELGRRLKFFSAERPNLYSFRERDFFPVPAPEAAASLQDRVLAYLAARGIDLSGGRVELVTMPRMTGYWFNPVSFYFCHNRAGECVAVLPEITNTFLERKIFCLGPDTRREGVFQLRVPKHFYVSPFSDVDVAFDFQLRPCGDRLAVQIDDYASGQRTLTSTLSGRARPLTDSALLALTLRYPLMPLRSIGLIHWHALRLWLKRVPWFAKAARAADQRDVLHPHASLMGLQSGPKLGDDSKPT